MAIRINKSLLMGVIIEKGENENGYYVKYDNGYMECWNTIKTSAQNTEFHYQYDFWTFPIPFSKISEITATPKNWTTLAHTIKTWCESLAGCYIMQHAIDPLTGLFHDRVNDAVVVVAKGFWK